VHEEKKKIPALALGALGIVFGDIGTSPLYSLRECFHGAHAISPEPDNVLGVVSLILWSLIAVISIKYVVLIMRADNQGEGGILALMSLVCPRPDTKLNWFLIVLGIFGAALLYGDGMITPAISVLSAVEGLETATTVFQPYIIPITISALAAIFLFQSRGTGKIGAIFGPLMLVWFVCLALLGIRGIVLAPEVLKAINPTYAVQFFLGNGVHALIVMGSVFLVVTGGEALYADMGHFGRRPIRLAWFFAVLPSLLIHYFGQGGLLLHTPSAASNPFYLLVPSVFLYPMVILSTLATCIASQAVITGAFSLTFQAIQIGYLPRFAIRHTSADEMGQIYIPYVNLVLFIATIGLVLGFGSSSHLAAAYGIAVTATMLLTTILAYVAMLKLWKWHFIPATLAAGSFFLIDLMFFSANAIKIEHGGWFPLLVGIVVFTIMTTWWRGRRILLNRLDEITPPLDAFIQGLRKNHIPVIKGTAIYMTRNSEHVPPALALNVQLNRVIHRKVVFLTVVNEPVPRVSAKKRFEVLKLKDGFVRVIIHHGFLNDPNIPRLVARLGQYGYKMDEDAIYVLGKETVLATNRPGMAIWREKLFAFMSRNAHRATTFFQIPADRVVEIGTQIEL